MPQTSPIFNHFKALIRFSSLSITYTLLVRSTNFFAILLATLQSAFVGAMPIPTGKSNFLKWYFLLYYHNSNKSTSLMSKSKNASSMEYISTLSVKNDNSVIKRLLISTYNSKFGENLIHYFFLRLLPFDMLVHTFQNLVNF
jgi:hypothetical protein